MSKYDDLRSSLKINQSALDEEIVRQPSLFAEVCDEFVKAAATRDTLKEKLTRTDAVLYGEIRDSLDKPTEAMIKNLIEQERAHIDATEEHLEAKEWSDRWMMLKEAFSQRSYMLRDLVSLFNANYFEKGSVKGTKDTEEYTYTRQRERLADARTGSRRKARES